MLGGGEADDRVWDEADFVKELEVRNQKAEAEGGSQKLEGAWRWFVIRSIR